LGFSVAFLSVRVQLILVRKSLVYNKSCATTNIHFADHLGVNVVFSFVRFRLYFHSFVRVATALWSVRGNPNLIHGGLSLVSILILSFVSISCVV
jgi:hypothetical protein